MICNLKKPALRAFTLIELLIVVAIIAILAAIAVPNFLEAQTRAKVSRCAADMRTIRTGMESYRVDNNHYPETDFGAAVFNAPAGAGMDRLSTPISYLTSVPRSPFKEENMGGNAPNNRHCQTRVLYLYVRAKRPNADDPSAPIANGYPSPPGSPAEFDSDYQTDRVTYKSMNSSLAENIAARTSGFWEIKSVGPNNIDDRTPEGFGNNARPYDPTNGTISAGDVVVFNDIQGFAGR